MKGDPKVIEILNEVLKNELTAINQYFLHSRMMRNWGVTKLAQFEYEQSIDEMMHADQLIERILFLDGLPNVQDIGRLLIGEDIKEMLECDLQLEKIALETLKPGIAHCESVSDFVSRNLLREILQSEEEHIDLLEAQFDLIERTGIQNYVALQSGAVNDEAEAEAEG